MMTWGLSAAHLSSETPPSHPKDMRWLAMVIEDTESVIICKRNDGPFSVCANLTPPPLA